jgi:hypothetical protein
MTLIDTTYDVLTGETTVRDYTKAEAGEYEAERALNAKALLEATTQAEEKATAKAALLNRLGISADEAALLLS